MTIDRGILEAKSLEFGDQVDKMFQEKAVRRTPVHSNYVCIISQMGLVCWEMNFDFFLTFIFVVVCKSFNKIMYIFVFFEGKGLSFLFPNKEQVWMEMIRGNQGGIFFLRFQNERKRASSWTYKSMDIETKAHSTLPMNVNHSPQR